MTINKAVFILAGTVVSIGSILALTVNPAWAYLSLFAGLNLFQSAFTGFCPAVYIFRALGLKD